MQNGSQRTVLIERGNQMMSIILNRPQNLNSLTTEMTRIIGEALDQAEREENIGFVLFRRRGKRVLCGRRPEDARQGCRERATGGGLRVL